MNTVSRRPTTRNGRPPRRRWWQVLFRITALLVLMLSLLWALMPWWIPAGYLRTLIEKELSRSLDMAVAVDNLSVSRSGGILVEGITISSADPGRTGDRPGPAEPRVRIERTRLNFAPADLLFRNRIAWIEIDGLHGARLDITKKIDLAQLERLVDIVSVGRVTIRRSRCALTAPGADAPLVLNIHDLQLLEPGQSSRGVLTMSAGVRQPAADAPLALKLTAGGPGDDVAVEGSLHFSHFDINASGLAPLVVRHGGLQEGQFRGELKFRVNREGRLDGLGLFLAGEDLCLQPPGRRDTVAVAEASLDLSADIDALVNRVDVTGFTLRMPGVDLAGSLTAYLDIDAVRHSGFRIEDCDSLALRGTAHPRSLARLTGRTAWLDAFGVDGPVDLDLSAERDDRDLVFAAAVRCDRSELRIGERIIKRVDVPAAAQLSGRFIYRGRDELVVKKAAVSLAGDTISASGNLVFSRRDAENRFAPGALQHVDLRGRVNVSGFERVLRAATGTARAGLAGRLAGTWTLRGGEQPYFSASLKSPSATEFTAGTWFVKAPGKKLSAVVGAAVDYRNRRLRDLFAGVTIDDGTLDIAAAELGLREDGRVECTGRFEADRIERLLACLPAAAERRTAAGGRIRGNFSGVFGDRYAGVSGSLDLKSSTLAIGEYFSKPPGKKMTVTLNADLSPDPGEAGKRSVTAVVDFGESLNISLRADLFGTDLTGPVHAELNGRCDDLRSVLDLSPFLARSLKGCRARGDLTIKCTASSGDGDRERIAFEAACRSRCLDLDLGDGDDRFFTCRQQPALVRVSGRVAATGDRAAFGDLEGEIHLSHNRVHFRETALAVERAAGGAAGTTTGSARVTWDVAPGDLLGRMLPAVASRFETLAVRGRCSGRAALRLGADSIALSSRLDLTRTGIVSGEDFNKPPGIDAALSLELSAPRVLSELEITRLTIGAAGVTAVAGGHASREGTATGPFAPFSLDSGYATITVPDASVLGAFLPSLEACKPSGALSARGEWTSAGGGRFSAVDLRADGCAAVYNGRAVTLDGAVSLEGVSVTTPACETGAPDGRPALRLDAERIRTERLEAAAGRYRGWFSADISGGRENPRGRFNAIVTALDLDDFSDWLAGAKPGPRVPEVTAREPESDHGPLDKKERTRLEKRGDELIGAARDILEKADVKGTLSFGAFAAYDGNLGRRYTLSGLEVSLGMFGGNLSLQFDAGYNGGSVSGELSTDIGVREPVVIDRKTVDEIAATEEVRPMISREFPGNEVTGLFSRKEQFRYPLRAFLAGFIDERYRLIKVGTTRMVATEGIISGRAAPEFVTNIFPGLNLTRYRYDELTGFSEYKPDGSSNNEMICSGAYDLYLRGTTEFDGEARYTVGIIIPLPGVKVPAEWHHDWKQGRVPILKISGRIRDGKLIDEAVSYPWPNESLFEMFLQNNIFYRIWVNSKNN